MWLFVTKLYYIVEILTSSKYIRYGIATEIGSSEASLASLSAARLNILYPRPVCVYQIQAEGTLGQVVQARVEGKADVQDLLMEHCKNKPRRSGVLLSAHA